MRRVSNAEDANYCVIFTRNKVSGTKVIDKFYYHLPLSIHCANMVMDIIHEHPALAQTGIRMDIYNVRNGRICLYD